MLIIIRNSFVSLMPLTIISSIFVLIKNFPISSVTSFMEKNAPLLWNTVLPSIPNAFNNVISLYLLISISYSYAIEKKKDPLLWILNSVFSFFIFMNFGKSNSIMQSLGTNGIFYAMFVAAVASYLLKVFSNCSREFNFNDSIPKEVASSFSYILPSLYSTLCIFTIRLFLSLLNIDNPSEKINQLIQIPITHLGSTLPAIVFINFGITILWFFGFNGSYLFNSIMNPIYFSLNLDNMNAVLKGKTPPHIITGSFQSLFIQFGGSGSTLALIIAILIFSKNQKERTIGKLGIIPAMFNINEPIVYGYPIILNFRMLVPFLLCPIVNTILTYFSMAADLVTKTNGIQIPWTTPPIISGFLVSGLSGGILQICLIAIDVLIYAPFLKRNN